MAAGFASRPQINTDPEIEEITTEQLAFNALGGASKLKLLPSPWPTSGLPPPTSSLLSISSAQGLLAAAGPDAIVIAATEAVRKALDSQPSSESKVIPFQPQLTLPSASRTSQVCFTADGSHLIVSAETGGGLRVYETAALKQGNTGPAFELHTENIAVRSIVPNPSVENAHVAAVILSGGQLMMANLQGKEFATGSGGSKIIKDSVSCVSWSVKGKQVVAGLGDGTACQLDPTGVIKAAIPKPPTVEGDQHVSDIVWLANDEFLTVHTPTSSDDPDRAPDSTLHHVRTNKDRSSFSFSKFAQDPAPPFGFNRSPPSHYFCRVRNWHHLLDALIVSSVASPDIGLITKSDAPFSGDIAAERITNVYTNTSFAADSSRATLPMSEETMVDTSPIGMAMDFSSKEKVTKPIMGDDMEESPFPLPALMVLDHEGVLSAWWFVYIAALREGIPFPSPVAGNDAKGLGGVPKSPTSNTLQASPFGASSSPTQGFSGFAKPASTAFGQSAFGSLGPKSSSPWGASPNLQAPGSAFGKPAFGQSSFGQPAFGQSGFKQGAGTSAPSGFGTVGGLGQNQSPWSAKTASAGGTAQPAPAFGQTAFSKFSATGSNSSPFGGLTSAASPFALQNKPAQPVFGSASTSSVGRSFGTTPEQSFGSTVTIDSITGGSTVDNKSLFGTPTQTSSVFGKSALRQDMPPDEDMMDEGSEGEEAKPAEAKEVDPAAAEKPKSGLFGLPSGGFQLGTSFKPAESAVEKDQDIDAGNKSTLFGSDFAKNLEKTETKSAAPVVDEEAVVTPSSISPQPEAPKPIEAPKPTEAPKPIEAAKEMSVSAATTPQAQEKQVTSISPIAMQMPEPPQVTSKPIPSPATAQSPTTSKSISREQSPRTDTPPIDLGRPGFLPSQVVDGTTAFVGPEDGESSDDMVHEERISGNEEGGDDESESADEEIDRGDVLPPDPSTVKKPAWWGEPLPGTINPAQRPLFPTPIKQSLPKAVHPIQQAASASLGSSTTPAGYPKVKISFNPPGPIIYESPRSPSPIRSTSTPVLGRLANDYQPPKPQPCGLESPLTKTPVYAADLQDTADEDVRKYLARPVEPNPDSRKLQFQAHQDYLSKASNEGVPAQIERVYKDINSMVDTLGVNARCLTNFVAGQSIAGKKDRERDDLQDSGDWTLVELGTLSKLEDEMDQDVDQHRLTLVDEMIKELGRTKKSLFKIRQDLINVRQVLDEKRDLANQDAVRSAPLEPLHAAKQQELRTAFATFQKQLAEAEDAALTLRTRIASASGKTDKRAIPTVEAVENTIKKMIGMIKQRSSEVDVLEAQMRKLGMTGRGGTPTADVESLRESLRRSVGPDESLVSSFKRMGMGSRGSTPSKGTPLRQSLRQQTTPQKKRGSEGYGVPGDDSDEDAFEDARRAVQPTAEIKHCLEMQARRKAITDVLKRKLLDRAQGIKPEPQD